MRLADNLRLMFGLKSRPRASASRGDDENTDETDEVDDSDDADDADETTSQPDRQEEPAPAEHERPWWGMGDMMLWWGLGIAFSLVGFTVLPSLLIAVGMWSQAEPGAALGEIAGRLGSGQIPKLTVVTAQYSTLTPIALLVLQVPLWGALIGGPIYVTRAKGTTMREDFGWSMKWIDIPVGLVAGLVGQLIVIQPIYWILQKIIGEQDVSGPAREITRTATNPLGIAIVFVLVTVGTPIAEELFYRGLAQRAIIKRLGVRWGILAAATFFAAAHLEPLQFPGLLAIGLILGVLAQRAGRIAPAIWAHLAFNLTATVTEIWNLHLP